MCLKLKILIPLLIMFAFNMKAQEKIDFNIENVSFINYLETFIDTPVKNFIDSLIINGYYYDSANEKEDLNRHLIGWEMNYEMEKLTITLFVQKFSFIDPIMPSAFNYPGNNYDFITFQKERISQIMIRQNMEEDPLNHYYKWIILPREKEKSNKNIKK